MKKLIAVLALATTSMTAFADPHWGGHHHGGYYGGYYGPQVIHQNHSYYRGSNAGDILLPMVIGGVVGWSINEASRQPQIYQQPQVIYQQPPVIYQQAPTVNYQKCTPWVESVDQYGVTTRTRTCY